MYFMELANKVNNPLLQVGVVDNLQTEERNC